MAKRARVVRIAIASVLAAGAVGALGGRAYVRSALPSHDGTKPLAGLGEDVTVLRDEHGVPSIFAASEEDVYRALGYVHAQDRLWQMEFFRRVADGRLAEIFGADLVETDEFMRTLGLGRAAEADEARLDDAARRDAEAYVAGVNAFLNTRTGALPPEFLILRFSPEPWTVRNTLSIAKIIAADLASWGLELEHQRAVDIVGAERAAELVPDYPSWGPTILGAAAPLRQPREGEREREHERERAVRFASAAGEVPLLEFSQVTRDVLATVSASHASNAWVIGGAKTASGKPIVANDAHLTLRAPSLWYLAALRGGPVARAGVTIPGIPGVVLGKAPTFAWGFTDAMVDDVDFYVERAAGEGAYMTPTGPRAFERREEVIKVRGGDDVHHVVRATRHGPVVSDVDDRAGKERVLAMRWTAIEPATGMNALARMNRASTWQEFVESTREFDTAKQNMVFGADDGTIGYVLLGKVPVRKKGDGLLPVPGWTDEYEWERVLTPEEKPKAINPQEGFIVTANNRQVGGDYPFMLTRIWASPFRAMRIREMVTRGDKLTAADVAKQQMDMEDAMAKRYLPHALKAAELAGENAAHDTLAQWNGEALPDSRGAALFWMWLESLRKRVGEDEWKGQKMYFPRFALLAMLDKGGGSWVDDIRTPQVETLDDVSRDAMKDAVRAVGNQTWGDLHATYVEHPLGRVKALDAIFGFNMKATARGGSSYTVNVAGYGETTPPFKSKEGASHREIVDLGNPDDAGGFMIPTGQAGHPSSDQYRDLFPLWVRGDVLPIPLDRAKAEVRARHRMVLSK